MIKVLKFGGTSVGSADNMKRVAEIIVAEKATVTVLSAMSGTTDALSKICGLAAHGGSAGAIETEIEVLVSKYSECVHELLQANREQALEKVEDTFMAVRREIDGFQSEVSPGFILAQGELLTSAIFALYMQERGNKTSLLHAPSFMRTDESRQVDTPYLHSQLAHQASGPDTFYITQGFICTDHRGSLNNLGRGGSDYSAALVGSALAANEVQIWTDIDGMHNNDPRFVSDTYPIPHMSFDEAAELAYFGAKILHPATILPCKEKSIPVLLKNTMDPKAAGTTISKMDDDLSTFHAVAAKDGITVIRIYSARMLMAYGFLRKVFEVFEKYQTPIDMITTSEVAVSLTIDNDSNLPPIMEELANLGTIEIERDKTIVCVVGTIEHSNSGVAAEVFDSIRHIPIKMISYGASHRSIALLIDKEHKKEILQCFNDALFSKTADLHA